MVDDDLEGTRNFELQEDVGSLQAELGAVVG
jgi:hypothetical protein